MHHSVALASSVAAALALGGSAVLQHGAAAAHPDLGAFRLVLRLVRTPRWLAGRCLDLLAFGLHAVALANGPLVLVQAVLATSLLVALAIGAASGHHRLSRSEWLSASAVAAGLLVLLVVGHPRGGAPPSAGGWAAISLAAVLATAGVLLAEPHLVAAAQAAALGAVSGVLFAIDAAFLKAALERSTSLVSPLRHWETAAFLATALVGNLLVARAFQRARLTASLPGVTAAEPVAAIVIGLAFFGEHLRPGALARTAELAAVTALVGGVLYLARSPTLMTATAADADHTPDPSEDRPVHR